MRGSNPRLGPLLRKPFQLAVTSTKQQQPRASTWTTLRRTILLRPQTQHLSSWSLTQPRPRILSGTRSPSPLPSRTFLNLPNLFPSASPTNNNNQNDSEIRTLRASRTLPFPPAPLFEIIASVHSYSDFLPFLTASTVTKRDPATGYPTEAFLTVGYGPFSETFTSRVDCDPRNWVVEARSGGKSSAESDDGRPVPGADEGIFSFLLTRWTLLPRESVGGNTTTEVNLEIRFRFENPVHTAMMAAVEDKVAAVMIEAFERRIREKMAES
ncbi:hypothetical protein VTN49DRAFT_4053 [Thermomyces lanuginosus]|uniref:uncharacterized protein n=1 Tax=Thermomyces lanuginosus TaxID=5541 RepID=UPI003742B891